MSTLKWLAAIVLLLALVATTMMVVDLRRAYRRIGQGSVVVPGPQGDIEFSQGGRGLPVLVVHGSGGGHDQGALWRARCWAMSSGGLRRRVRVLSSTFHGGATFEQQAHACAYLLDILKQATHARACRWYAGRVATSGASGPHVPRRATKRSVRWRNPASRRSLENRRIHPTAMPRSTSGSGGSCPISIPS